MLYLKLKKKHHTTESEMFVQSPNTWNRDSEEYLTLCETENVSSGGNQDETLHSTNPRMQSNLPSCRYFPARHSSLQQHKPASSLRGDGRKGQLSERGREEGTAL